MTEYAFVGPAANKFMEAATKYMDWLDEHAGTAAKTAGFLNEAARAYDKAVASMTPYTSIGVNRSCALALKAINLLGQFTTKIADLEREY
ncbi:PPE family protein [Mycobacterium haemophilum DSM 44634]|uniref:PPE domain-containing protein n=1 Tax=Mycobacterium haemophilum TaxID=29311 RepID=UPI0006D41232|nr:PPE domain-containing protein [Mycobacterium haemophilum]ALL56204.1 hypothetical protein B586_01450 [Mycobacterium haemophilum DSM 44634]MCV7342617.1 PPE domain-containing protein [Mycobacterium haemophilum DSM 44634]